MVWDCQIIIQKNIKLRKTQGSVTDIFLLKNPATPPRHVCLRLSRPHTSKIVCLFTLSHFVAEGGGLEPPRACARRFSKPVHYHSANPPYL